jgi:hypothetical protein
MIGRHKDHPGAILDSRLHHVRIQSANGSIEDNRANGLNAREHTIDVVSAARCYHIVVFENHRPHAIIDSDPGQFGVIEEPRENGRACVAVAIDRTAH